LNMSKTPGVGADTAHIAAALLKDPIDFFLSEHNRQLEFCDALETLADVMEIQPVKEQAAVLLRFMTEDLPLHIEDEEQDLFPLLMSGREQQTEINQALAQLITEHEGDKELVRPIVADLQEINDGRALADPARFHRNVQVFCGLQRRHLIWENRLVLPLAKRSLSNAEKAELRRRMIAKRETRARR